MSEGADEAAGAVAARPLGRPVGRPRAGARRPRRRLWLISPEGFRELRHSCLLSRKQAAAYLGVCLRTLRHWETGRNRVPWSAVRLLRVMRAGELGGLLDGWEGWTIWRDRLVSPDGRVYFERDMRHHWLTVTQARLFREGYDRATLPSAAQPRERLEGASTFPRPMVGQGENRTRETERAVSRQERPFPAEPAFQTPEASDRHGVLPGKCTALSRQDASAEQAGAETHHTTGFFPVKCSALGREDARSEGPRHFSHLPAAPSVGGFGSVECVHSAGAKLSASQPAPLDQRSWYVPTFNKGLKPNIWLHTGGILPPLPISSLPPESHREDSP